MIAPREVALAGLLRIFEPPVRQPIAEFVASMGPEAAWRAVIGRSAPAAVQEAAAPRLGARTADDLDVRARGDVSVAHGADATVIGPGDPGWPGECCEPLAWVPPYDAARGAAAPLALYYRGDLRPVSPRGSVAVVGSRAATPYGVRVATELAASAAGQGFVVVSGAAFGIDAAAHRGALHRDGPVRSDDGGTVAVLACGIDRPYPAAHRPLLDRIGLDGAIVSEYPPGSTPQRHRFLVRNRLIAAFAEATVVVEAGRRSGSLNTATTAANLSRQVFAVPGPVTSALSLGCHELIRSGRAQLAADWRDIVELLGELTPAPVGHRIGHRPTDGLDLVAGRVHDSLPARGVVSVDALAADAALPVPEVLGALAVLHTHGLATRRDGQWCRVS